jgi:preprotein translocase subunit SecE
MEQDEAKSGSLVARAREFVKDVRVESTKVSWPTRIELRDSTAVVIVTVLLVSVFLFIVDRALQSALGLLFR